MAMQKQYSIQYSKTLGDTALGYMKAAKRRIIAKKG
jgi:hypothetical protein